MTKSTASLPLTIALHTPTYWTPEQAFAAFQLVDHCERQSGSATRCRSRTNTAITSAQLPPSSAPRTSAIHRSDRSNRPTGKSARPATGPLFVDHSHSAIYARIRSAANRRRASSVMLQ